MTSDQPKGQGRGFKCSDSGCGGTGQGALPREQAASGCSKSEIHHPSQQTGILARAVNRQSRRGRWYRQTDESLCKAARLLRLWEPQE
jgi:hypothetical protein